MANNPEIRIFKTAEEFKQAVKDCPPLHNLLTYLTSWRRSTKYPTAWVFEGEIPEIVNLRHTRNILQSVATDIVMEKEKGSDVAACSLIIHAHNRQVISRLMKSYERIGRMKAYNFVTSRLKGEPHPRLGDIVFSTPDRMLTNGYFRRLARPLQISLNDQAPLIIRKEIKESPPDRIVTIHNQPFIPAGIKE